ncbi:MAG: RNA polymerase sigma factor [Sandaracinaceae bacterium]
MTLLSLAFSALADAPRAPVAETGVQAWVRRAREGDREAAAQLYRTYAQKVYRTVRALAASDAEAEDLTQDTFAKAFEALDRYEQRDGVRFVSWLLSIAMNLARRAHQKRRRTAPLPPERLAAVPDEVSLPPDGALERATLRAALLGAIEALPEREREIVTLTYGGELTSTEVADLTGVRAAHVRKILERARLQLRAALRRRLGDPSP